MYYDVVVRGATHRVFVEEYTADVIITAAAVASAGQAHARRVDDRH